MAFLVVLYEEHVSAVLDSGNHHHIYIVRSLISLTTGFRCLQAPKSRDITKNLNYMLLIVTTIPYLTYIIFSMNTWTQWTLERESVEPARCIDKEFSVHSKSSIENHKTMLPKNTLHPLVYGTEE